jgi:GNAT superfamily N-acetyltransferase
VATYPPQVPPDVVAERLPLVESADWRDRLRQQHEIGGDVIIAEASGDVVGFCQYGRDESNHLRGRVRRLYIVPAYQRRGLGRALLAGAVDGLQRLGCTTATLSVLADDQRARTFYEDAGWRWDGTTSDSPTDLTYRRSLHPRDPSG